MFSITDQLPRIAACGLLALLAAAASSCGDSDNPDAASASCGAFDDLTSYRYTIAVKMELPAFQEHPNNDPGLAAYAANLSALFSNFQVDGAYVAPDRRQAVLAFQDARVELRQIGDQRWEHLGESWEPLDAGAPDIGDLAPKTVCTDIVEALTPGLSPAASEDEVVNGISSRRYWIEGANIDRLDDLLGLSDGAQMPDQFQVNVWFATDGDWPVRLTLHSQTSDQVGATGTADVTMELRDVNASDIAVDEPQVNAGG